MLKKNVNVGKNRESNKTLNMKDSNNSIEVAIEIGVVIIIAEVIIIKTTEIMIIGMIEGHNNSSIRVVNNTMINTAVIDRNNLMIETIEEAI